MMFEPWVLCFNERETFRWSGSSEETCRFLVLKMFFVFFTMDNFKMSMLQSFFGIPSGIAKYQKDVKKEVTKHPLRPYAKNVLIPVQELKDRKDALDKDETKTTPNDDILFIPPFMLRDEDSIAQQALSDHTSQVIASQGNLFLQQQQRVISNYLKYCSENNQTTQCKKTNACHDGLVESSFFKMFNMPNNGLFQINANTAVKEGKKIVFKDKQLNQSLHPLLPDHVIVTYKWNDDNVKQSQLKPNPIALGDNINWTPFPCQFEKDKHDGDNDDDEKGKRAKAKQQPKTEFLTIFIVTKETVAYDRKINTPFFVPGVQPLLLHDVATSMYMQQKVFDAMAHMSEWFRKYEECHQEYKDLLDHYLHIKEYNPDSAVTKIWKVFTNKPVVTRAMLSAQMKEKQKEMKDLLEHCNRMREKHEETKLAESCQKAIYWTYDAYLCSIDNHSSMCQLPYHTQVIPIKETLPTSMNTWPKFHKKYNFAECQALIAICNYLIPMQGLFPNYIHGNLTKHACYYFDYLESLHVKVCDYTRTYLPECCPLIGSEDDSWIQKDSSQQLKDFTFCLTYIITDKSEYSVLMKWYDIFTFINSLRSDECKNHQAIFTLLKDWEGFGDKIVQDLLIQHTVKDFNTQFILHWKNSKLQLLSKYEIKDLSDYLQTQFDRDFCQ